MYGAVVKEYKQLMIARAFSPQDFQEVLKILRIDAFVSELKINHSSLGRDRSYYSKARLLHQMS